MAGSSTYPTSIDNKTALQDGVDIIQADDVNDAYVPIDSIETFVGAAGAAQNRNIDILQYLHEMQHPTTRIHVSYVSATTVRLSVGALMCNKSDDTVRVLRRLTSVVDITFADLDTGAEAASTRYDIIAVADNAASTVTGKLVISGNTPSGVTNYWVVGSIWNNESSDFESESLVNYDDDPLNKGHLVGGVISNHATANWLSISATTARDATDAYNIKAPALNKNVGTTFTPGTGGGFLDTGTVGNGMYYIWLIWGPTKHGDYIASTSSTSPTMPTGYTYKRLIGGRRYNSSDWVDHKTYGEGREKKVFYDAWQSIASGNAGTGGWTSIDTTAFVPAGTSKDCFGAMQGITSGHSMYLSNVNTGTRANGQANVYCALGSDEQHFWELNIITANTLYWASDGASATTYLIGFKESL